jgi:hypothetical protein
MPGSTALGLLRGYVTLAEGPRLLAAFRDGKVFQKRVHFPENVILLNMLISKDVGE